MKEFCKSNSFQISVGIRLFWSIKESFWKSLGLGIQSKSIYIDEIYKGNVKLRINNEVKEKMKKENLTLKSIKFKIKNPYIYSITLMKKSPTKNKNTYNGF